MTAAEDPSKKYDQAFFLDLAAKGKDAWNAWRCDPANKDVRVTFAGIDFAEAPKDQIDFSGCEFSHHTNFSKCKWRGAEWREWEDNRETFTPGRACFTGATFGHGARFYGVAFGNGADFSDVKFGHDASFPGALFGHGTFFKDAAFGYRASFDGAAFGNGVSFSGAAFGGEANFNGAAFGDLASFTGAAFGDLATFDRAAFDGQVSFASAAFGSQASFEGAAFVGQASFAGAAFGSQASFEGAHFNCVNFIGRSVEQARRILGAIAAEVDEKVEETRVALKKRHEDSWERDNSGPHRFLTISFVNARFYGVADFSGRTFERAANFTNARFYRPPDFDPTIKDARIDFTGARIGFVPPGKLHWTSDSKVPTRLRALRKIAEETRNHDLERDLYIEERKAECGVDWHQLVEELKKAPEALKSKLADIDEHQREIWLNWRHRARARIAHVLGIAVKIARLFAHLLWILLVMGVYWALADYGRSVARPAIALGLSWYGSYWLYRWVLSSIMATARDIDRYKHAVGMVALGNAVPFVGPLTIDGKIKKFLFCPNGAVNCQPPIPPEGFQALIIGQNLFSITCVFFIVLALRNYFRIK